MLPADKPETATRFILLYDKYSPTIYGLLLRLLSTKSQAETALVEVFDKIYRQNLYCTNAYCTAVLFTRLTVITAYKHHSDTVDFVTKLEALPKLQRLLIGNINLQTAVTELPLQSGEYGRELGGELKKFMQTHNLQTPQLPN